MVLRNWFALYDSFEDGKQRKREKKGSLVWVTLLDLFDIKKKFFICLKLNHATAVVAVNLYFVTCFLDDNGIPWKSIAHSTWNYISVEWFNQIEKLYQNGLEHDEELQRFEISLRFQLLAIFSTFHNNKWTWMWVRNYSDWIRQEKVHWISM